MKKSLYVVMSFIFDLSIILGFNNSYKYPGFLFGNYFLCFPSFVPRISNSSFLRFLKWFFHTPIHALVHSYLCLIISYYFNSYYTIFMFVTNEKLRLFKNFFIISLNILKFSHHFWMVSHGIVLFFISKKNCKRRFRNFS